MGRKPGGVRVSVHKGRARARWTSGGIRHEIDLAAEGDDAAINAALSRLHNRLSVDPMAAPRSPADYLVSELLRDYVAARRAEGIAAWPLKKLRFSFAKLNAIHAETAVNDFGPRAFHEFLSVLAKGLKRTTIEKDARHIRQAWKWAAQTERIPESAYRALTVVDVPRTAGRSKTITPADPAEVRKTIRKLPAPLAALVQIQLATGARPSELLDLTPGQLIRKGKFTAAGIQYTVPPGQWVRVIDTSKTGIPRLIYFPPASVAILSRLCRGRPADRPIFRPADHTHRGGERYSAGGYRQAVRRAAKLAGVQPWNPYQLRHLRKAQVMESLGADAAKALLGHSSPVMTARYAAGKIDAGRAAKAAKLPT